MKLIQRSFELGVIEMVCAMQHAMVLCTVHAVVEGERRKR